MVTQIYKIGSEIWDPLSKKWQFKKHQNLGQISRMDREYLGKKHDTVEWKMVFKLRYLLRMRTVGNFSTKFYMPIVRSYLRLTTNFYSIICNFDEVMRY